jgi:hypothetical protein
VTFCFSIIAAVVTTCAHSLGGFGILCQITFDEFGCPTGSCVLSEPDQDLVLLKNDVSLFFFFVF